MSKIKIAIISHALVQKVAQRRWKKLAEDKNYEVHIFVPKYWESYWFKEKVIFKPEEIHNDNYHVYPLKATDVKSWGKYFLKGLCKKLKEINPDLIYIIHEESIWIHHQIYLCNWLNLNKSKIIFFSMNGMGVPYKKAKNPIKKFIHWLMFQNIKLNTKAVLVHYPGCVKSLREGGYHKPIYMQTQVGVDEELFAPNEKIRDEYRKKLGFSDNLVLGYTGRLTPDKGVDNIANVFIKLSKKYDNLRLLLVGNGDIKEDLEVLFKKEKVDDKVCITGFVDQAEVPNYMNAMDIFILGSKTTSHWIDTFPLVTVQAQAVGIPVIASNSASIPWQLGDSALIFEENNEEDLEKKLEIFINDKKLRKEYAIKGRERSLKYFCHNGMNENFKKIVTQVMENKFIFHEKDEEYTQWKGY